MDKAQYLSREILRCVFLFFPLLLLGADHRISQASRQRHQAIREHYKGTERLGWWEGRTMTGDWEGRLTKLARMGITFDSNFTTDIAANPVGGQAKGFAYAGSYGLSLNINCEKVGFQGLDLFSSAVWRTGTSLSQRKIGNQFPVQQVFGSQTVKLNELYLSLAAWEEGILIKAGRLDAGNDFLASPLYSRYVNNGFNGNPVAVFFNVPFTAYPNSTWGAYLFCRPYQYLSMKYAAFNANSDVLKAKYHGVNFTFQSTNGVLWITEWCALVNQEQGASGMPGHYKVGYYYMTGDEPKFTGGKQRGDQCLYFLFDQMIVRQGGSLSTRGLTSFISLLLAPKNRNLFPFYFDAGLQYRGLFPGRPDDYLSLGYIYGKYSSTQARVQRSEGKEAENFETVWELSYWAQINQWFYITPDLQYIVHPRGLHIPNAFVIAAQIGFDIW
ncbi:MAG: hypothetical protein A3D96_01040 [Chlamydiae bacterium RIFCSPHIGHO2_12_FULL_44_59]|nr:MAG: hypothetical protein A2796_00615 [Chlamydiae bacterium RIFCSPHIGHO2_01_FULL_44_39]OGN60456.1 MAG: hypothetical protein A3D96_01040 [Chlamydiae bacterium RIFCSPHIGHO2_12_FULL_44_59]OGN66577.1 MAG: hypothetical protein A2978_05225 [Chlamydiae bacterium RIFCSPLOWO2_01_FULL_44_52]OGN69826.1 MAG: hypothetical protein A3I67_06980 [Chlamydiae bacterium RIFCSPLOWO2_02_FULL_45_22]OGN70366.1 MAG: hypothetical protein A3F79_00350 [Chlamydiae bacterium RIFCSPLOWO2_12_FULL_45_20]